MSENLPFEITPQIKRYLEELTFCDEFDFGGNEKSIVKTFDLGKIGERLSNDSFVNIEKFLKYLKSSELVKVDEFPKIIKTGKIKKIHPDTLKITILDQESLQNLTDYITQKENIKISDSSPHWDFYRKTLSYRDIKSYTFTSLRRSKLFNLLWKKRRHIISKEIIMSGTPIGARFLADNIKFSFNTKTDGYNEKGIQKLGDLAKDIGAYLKKKNFPITISTKGGLLLTFKE